MEYLNEKKELYEILLQYIDENEKEDEEEFNYMNLLDIIKKQKIIECNEDLKLFLRILTCISNNHHRFPRFYPKILRIIQHLNQFIKQNFSNYEIYKIFKSNKLLILYLIEHDVITIDNKIVTEMLYRSLKTNTKYHYFFYPEIKDHLDDLELEKIENELDEEILINFDYKRKIGENENIICELIRNDSIESFVSYVNRTNLSLSNTRINQSIFETNSFLLKNNPTLIEYAAFYGAVQIFQYLKYNNVDMQPSLFLYAIHSQNAELIHIIEENDIYPLNGNYKQCLSESIKCHHNEIALYIENKYLDKIEMDYKSVFQYHNYRYIPNSFDNDLIFYYMCRYGHYKLVTFYLDSKIMIIESLK